MIVRIEVDVLLDVFGVLLFLVAVAVTNVTTTTPMPQPPSGCIRSY